MSIDYRERRLRFWCQKVLPLVYDESLSYYELLCKIMKHLSEAETDVSALEQWLAELDAEAVKQVYSEYPLYATKSGNVVTLKRREDAKAPVTTFANEVGIEDNPITVTRTVGTTLGHLDPNDENSPEGVVKTEASATISIADATTDSRGAMSATDKSKLDALHEVIVRGGSSGNIQVGSSTSGYNRTYTVELNPNFEPSIKEWSLTGDEWEWNAALNGGTAPVYFSGSKYPNPSVWYATCGTAAMSPTYNTYPVRMGLQGVVNEKFSNVEPTLNKLGYVFGAMADNPFTNIEAAASVADGEPYFTTLNPIRIKCQMQGVGVANRAFKIYLGTTVLDGQNSPANTYKMEGNYYWPTSTIHWTPAEYSVTTDANGYFDVTIPAGLQAIQHTAGGNPPLTSLLCRQMAIIADGDPNELYGNIKVTTMKIAVKTNLGI